VQENAPSPSKGPPQVSPAHTISTGNQVELLSAPARTVESSAQTDVFCQQDVVNGHNFPPQPYPPRVYPNHPTPPTDAVSSPTHSSYGDRVPPQPVNLPSRPTPPNGSVKSSLQSSWQGDNQIQKVTFYADNAGSSNAGSSPTRSSYQGYAYGPPHQPTNIFPYQSGSRQTYEAFYDNRQSYYSPPTPFPFVGSQPPLTSSETPLGSAFQRQGAFDNYRASISSDGHPCPTVPRSDHSMIHQNKDVEHDEAPPRVGDASVRGIRPGDFADHKFAGPKVPNVEEDAWVIDIDEASMKNHLISNFNVDTYADCEMIVSHESRRFSPVAFSLHSLLIIQSHTIRKLFVDGKYEYGMNAKKVFRITLTDSFVTPKALGSALRLCYGEPASKFTGTTQKMHPPKSKAELSTSLMDESLAFAGAGDLLQLKQVFHRGLEIASKVLNWDNLERALSFALEYGTYRAQTPPSAISDSPQDQPHDSDSSPSTNTMLTPGSSQDSTGGLSSPNDSKTKFSPSGGNRQGDLGCADDLLTLCLRFLASNLPLSWELDPTARPLAIIDRLPVTAESKSPLSKSRLSKIQFGELPAEMTTKSSNRDTFISSMLLSLPFSALELLLSIGCASVQRHLDGFIRERERRRVIVLQSQSVTPTQRAAAKGRTWAEVGYTEFPEDVQDFNVRLSRQFTGIYQHDNGQNLAESQEEEV